MKIKKIGSVLFAIAALFLALAAYFLYGRYRMLQMSSCIADNETNVIAVEPEDTLEVLADLEPEPKPETKLGYYTVTSALTNLYRIQKDRSEARKYMEIPKGTVLHVTDVYKGFFICSYGDSDEDYCVDREQVKEGVYYVMPENGVDLRFVLPDVAYEILLASDQNITGHPLYPAVPMLETETAAMLKEASKVFEKDGYTIKIYDSYRPISAQYELFNIVRDPKFIADPNFNNSFHQVGRALDMSLIDSSTGKELQMPTPMHTFNDTASRYNRAAWTEEERQNVDYMTEVMERCGFQTISTEWWHFENGEMGEYMDPNLDYEALPLVSEEEYLTDYPQFS